MYSLLVALTIAATPATEARPMTLAAPGLSGTGVEPEVNDLYFGYFTQMIGVKGGPTVLTPPQVLAQLGDGKARELFACSEVGGPCVGEFQSLLSLDGIIGGTMVKAGKGYTVTIKLWSAFTGESIAVYSRTVPNDEGLLRFLESSAEEIVQASTRLRPTMAKNNGPEIDTSYERIPTSRGPSKLWIVPAVIGAGAFAVAGYEYYQAQNAHSRLVDGDRDINDTTELDRVVENGRQQQQYAAIAAGVGVLSVGVMTGILLATGSDAPAPRFSLQAGPNGGALVFGGTLP